jgi:hypothetical protein
MSSAGIALRARVGTAMEALKLRATALQRDLADHAGLFALDVFPESQPAAAVCTLIGQNPYNLFVLEHLSGSGLRFMLQVAGKVNRFQILQVRKLADMSEHPMTLKAYGNILATSSLSGSSCRRNGDIKHVTICTIGSKEISSSR